MQTIYTIGYTQKSLKEFVNLLEEHQIEKLIDIRLKNTSQLAGFAKQEDLHYILEHFLKMEYEHVPALSPTEKIFETYKKDKDWDKLRESFTALMAEKGMNSILENAASGKHRVCLLCSEDSPKHCHRRLVAEYYQEKRRGDVKIVHLTTKDAKP
jgi:uncharacterized protein (DUF488 family)